MSVETAQEAKMEAFSYLSQMKKNLICARIEREVRMLHNAGIEIPEDLMKEVRENLRDLEPTIVRIALGNSGTDF